LGRERSNDIRAWAKAQGITVSERGRIPASVAAQYRAATTALTPAVIALARPDPLIRARSDAPHPGLTYRPLVAGLPTPAGES
jgi:hypothetical protein